MKTCNKCKESKELSDFYYYKDTGKPRGQCKVCTNKDAVRYRSKGIGKQKAEDWAIQNAEARKLHVKRAGWKKLGMDPNLAQAYYLTHDGKCEICGNGCTSGSDLAMDHCHTSGIIRGMLCQKCNIALGHFQDSPELLARAIAYLNKSLKDADSVS